MKFDISGKYTKKETGGSRDWWVVSRESCIDMGFYVTLYCFDFNPA